MKLYIFDQISHYSPPLFTESYLNIKNDSGWAFNNWLHIHWEIIGNKQDTKSRSAKNDGKSYKSLKKKDSIESKP